MNLCAILSMLFQFIKIRLVLYVLEDPQTDKIQDNSKL
jgi:hypothetical protein